jgi:DNA-binding response OmpR family regulator
MARILLVEDDKTVCENIETWLRFERYTVDIVNDGAEALQALKNVEYELIILDWEIPQVSGIEVLRSFRSSGGMTPVLMLTGKSTILDKELGFDVGTDDYLTKPFHPKELTARLRALLRRPTVIAPKLIKAHDLELNIQEHSLTKSGERIDLQPMEYALLEFLMSHPEQVFSPEVLINRVWPGANDVGIDAVYVCIRRLRKKLNDEGDLIRTIRGVGYSFAAD